MLLVSSWFSLLPKNSSFICNIFSAEFTLDLCCEVVVWESGTFDIYVWDQLLVLNRLRSVLNHEVANQCREKRDREALYFAARVLLWI